LRVADRVRVMVEGFELHLLACSPDLTVCSVTTALLAMATVREWAWEPDELENSKRVGMGTRRARGMPFIIGSHACELAAKVDVRSNSIVEHTCSV
jgi:hypothetical protein